MMRQSEGGNMHSRVTWIRTTCVLLTFATLGLSNHASAAVQNLSSLVKCFGATNLCFSARVRCQTVADSINHRLLEVELIHLRGPGYFIPGWGGSSFITDTRRGAFPREAAYVGYTTFCASGGTHYHRSAHRREDLAFNTYEQVLERTEHIAGNPCGPIP